MASSLEVSEQNVYLQIFMAALVLAVGKGGNLEIRETTL